MAKEIDTSHRREVFVHDGYMYIFYALSANKLRKFWQCRYKDSCRPRIHTPVKSLEVI